MNITKLLENLKALYENDAATEDEKLVAKQKYEALSKKYSDRIEDEESEESTTKWFKVHTPSERTLIIQILCQIKHQSSIKIYSWKKSKVWLGADLTEAEYETANFLYKFYVSRLNEEIRLLTKAFILSNHIGNNTPSEGSHNPLALTEDEIKKMSKILNYEMNTQESHSTEVNSDKLTTRGKLIDSIEHKKLMEFRSAVESGLSVDANEIKEMLIAIKEDRSSISKSVTIKDLRNMYKSLPESYKQSKITVSKLSKKELFEFMYSTCAVN